MLGGHTYFAGWESDIVTLSMGNRSPYRKLRSYNSPSKPNNFRIPSSTRTVPVFYTCSTKNGYPSSACRYRQFRIALKNCRYRNPKTCPYLFVLLHDKVLKMSITLSTSAYLERQKLAYWQETTGGKGKRMGGEGMERSFGKKDSASLLCLCRIIVLLSLL